MLKPGDKAPDFSLPDQTGKMVSLKDFLGKQNVVLFFYPKDFTPGCTKEACSFRDDYADFKKLGAEVIGISNDPPESHGRFADQYKLPYPLLSDANDAVAKTYGLSKTFGLIPPRVSFVIDRSGTIRHAVSSQLSMDRHLEETREALEAIC